MLTKPKLQRRKKQQYAAIRTELPIPFGKYLGPMWKEVEDWLAVQGVKSTGPAIIRYLTTDMSKKLDLDIGFEIDKTVQGDKRVIVDTLPAGRYATLVYTGPYKGKGILKATVALLDWAKENDIVWDTSRRHKVEWWNGRFERYLTDPAIERDTSKYRAELCFLVK